MSLHLPTQAHPDLPTRWCLFDGNSLYLQDSQLPATPPGPHSPPRYIGHNDAANLYSAELIGPAPAGWQQVTLRQALYALPADTSALLARAAQLRRFHQTHRYCGACAGPLQAHLHDQGRHCPACGEVYYPRLSPAMMVLITRGREVLLARSPHFAPGMYSALAGFVEPGETLEACVHREAFEEVGVRLHTPRYAMSQSWPFPHSLMLAFVAEYHSGDITPQPGEIEDAAWFDIDALPVIPPERSIAYFLITEHIQQLRSQPAA